jgi:hypothetical protein
MERLVCLKCDRCEAHCKCKEPDLAPSYVDALAVMKAELGSAA